MKSMEAYFIKKRDECEWNFRQKIFSILVIKIQEYRHKDLIRGDVIFLKP